MPQENARAYLFVRVLQEIARVQNESHGKPRTSTEYAAVIACALGGALDRTLFHTEHTIAYQFTDGSKATRGAAPMTWVVEVPPPC